MLAQLSVGRLFIWDLSLPLPIYFNWSNNQNWPQSTNGWTDGQNWYSIEIEDDLLVSDSHPNKTKSNIIKNCRAREQEVKIVTLVACLLLVSGRLLAVSTHAVLDTLQND